MIIFTRIARNLITSSFKQNLFHSPSTRSFASTIVKKTNIEEDIAPPSKKIFSSEDILQALAESFPVDNFAAQDPFVVTYNPNFKLFEYKGAKSVDYIAENYPNFFELNTWVENSAPGFNSYSPTTSTTLDFINNCISLYRFDEVNNVLQKLGKDQKELTDNDINELFAKIVAIKLFVHSPEMFEFPIQPILQILSELHVKKSKWHTYLMQFPPIETMKAKSEVQLELNGIQDVNILCLIQDLYPASTENNDYIKQLIKSRRKPNVHFFNGLISGVQKNNIHQLVSLYSAVLHKMKELEICPTAETWIVMYFNVCRLSGNNNALSIHLLNNLKDSISEGKIEIFFSQTLLKIANIFGRTESYNDVKYIFNGLLPELSRLGKHRLANAFKAIYIERVCQDGTVSEIWEVINKYGMYGAGQIFNQKVFKKLVGAALREKQFGFLPVIYSIALLQKTANNSDFVKTWGIAAVETYKDCDSDTKKQFVSIANLHLSRSFLPINRKKRNATEEPTDVTSFLRLLIISNSVSELHQAFKTINYFRNKKKITYSKVIVNDAMALAKETGNLDFLRYLQQYFTHD